MFIADERKEETCADCKAKRICEYCYICNEWYCDECRGKWFASHTLHFSEDETY